MRNCFRAAVCLPLLLISCEEKEGPANSQYGGTPAKEGKPEPRATKSDRRNFAQKKAAASQRLADLDAADAIPSPEDRNRAIAKWVWDTYELDPGLANEGFERLTPGSEEKNRLLQHFAMRLAEKDSGEAASWAATLEGDEEKSLAYGRIAVVLSETDPESAARLLSDSGMAGKEFDVAVVHVVQQWAGSSPESAADWVTRFNASESRKAGLKAITSVWMTANPEASIAWMSSLPSKQIREEALSGFAEAVLEQPPILREMTLNKATPEMRSRFEELERRAREEEDN